MTLAGEAGVGKSALVDELCRRHAATATILRGRCDAMGTAQPLGPVHDIARSAPPLADVLAAELPRHRVFSVFLDLLTPPRGAVIVVLEDVHWADEATLDLLVFLGRRVADTHALVVATFRDDTAHPLRTVLGMLATASAVHRFEVPPLTRAAVAVLAGERGDPDRLYDITGGNPFFVTEVLDAPSAGVPPTVSDAVFARTAGLSAAARSTLDAAAVVPHRVDVALLREVAGTPDEAIDECQQAGVLVGDGRRLWFRHELARLAIEDSIPTARRSAIHGKVLAHLGPQADPARLAYHAEQAGDVEAVLRHAPVAAERAVALGAHREALAQFDRALRFIGDEPPRREAELLERYAVECRLTSRIDAGIAASARAMAIWDGLGEVDRRCAQQASHAALLWQRGHSTDARRMAEDAVSTLERSSPGPALAAALSNLASLKMLARDIPGAIATGRRAVALADTYGEQLFLAIALNAVGSAQWFDTPDEAPATLARSLAVARAGRRRRRDRERPGQPGLGRRRGAPVRRGRSLAARDRRVLHRAGHRHHTVVRRGVVGPHRVRAGPLAGGDEPDPRGRQGVDDARAGADRRPHGARSPAHPPR